MPVKLIEKDAKRGLDKILRFVCKNNQVRGTKRILKNTLSTGTGESFACYWKI